MEEDKKKIRFGVDNNTLSINNNDRKTEDWHCDFNGRIVIGNKLYWANIYKKNDDWMAGKVVIADEDAQKKLREKQDEVPPF